MTKFLSRTSQLLRSARRLGRIRQSFLALTPLLGEKLLHQQRQDKKNRRIKRGRRSQTQVGRAVNRVARDAQRMSSAAQCGFVVTGIRRMNRVLQSQSEQV